MAVEQKIYFINKSKSVPTFILLLRLNRDGGRREGLGLELGFMA